MYTTFTNMKASARLVAIKPILPFLRFITTREAGITRLTTETGAGQWGSAVSLACKMYDLECNVYMVKVSYEQKPYRRSFMQIYGANVIPSPSNTTDAGRNLLAIDPNSTGSLGIAISEAVEMAMLRKDTNYALGSVMNHVILHQTVIGLECKTQLENLVITLM